MSFLRIAWRDIINIFKNRYIRISVAAIIVVPLLYSLLYLYAFWDPYSKLSSLPVAIVNEDSGGFNDTTAVNYGNDIVDKLKDNTDVRWEFVDREEADAGTSGDKYYAEFIIPKDFTKNILNAKTGKPEQGQILYIANEKRNFLAAQVNERVVIQLKAEITKTITSEYTKVTFNNLYDIKDGFDKLADGSKQLKDGINTASDGSKSLMNGISKICDNIPILSKGVKQLHSGSQTLTSKLSEASTGTEYLNKKLTEAGDGASTLDKAISALAAGANQIKDGLNGVYDNNGNPVMADGQPQIGLKNAIIQLANGINGVYDKNGTPVIANGQPQIGLKNGITQLANGINGVYDKNGNPVMVNGQPQVGLKGGMSQLADGINGVYDKNGNPVMVNGQPQVGLVNATKGISNGVTALVDKIIVSSQSIQDGLNTAVNNDLKAYLAKNPSAMTSPEMLKFLSDLNALKSSGLTTSDINNMNYLKSSAQKVADSSTKLGTASKQLSSGVNTLSIGINTINNGTNALSVGVNTISSGTDKLASGSITLADGLNKVSNGSNSLSSGLKTAVEGTSTLASGTKQLYNGSSQVTEGLNNLNGKIPQLNSGAAALYDGSKDLSDGLNKLADGGTELSDKVNEGKDKLDKNLINSSDTMANYVSEPLEVKETPIDSVKTYGTGFAPYFIPLSLWVGAMLMFFIISDKVEGDIKVGSASLVLGKFLSYGYIGVLQAILTSVAVLVLGLKPNSLALYFIFNIFMSYAFIAIIQCFVFLFGQAGRLLSIVLLILQLTACAGTFPLELVPTFFKKLNPFMPFTYCVSSLREIIAGHDMNLIFKNVIVLGSAMFIFLIVSILLKNHADKIKEKISAEKNTVTI